MTAKVQDFEMHSGDTKQLDITVLDSTGATQNLTGMQNARWRLAKAVKSTTALISKTFSPSAGVTLVNATVAPQLKVDIVPADTDNIKGGSYYHELEVIDSAGRVQTVLYGTVTILDDLVDDV